MIEVVTMGLSIPIASAGATTLNNPLQEKSVEGDGKKGIGGGKARGKVQPAHVFRGSSGLVVSGMALRIILLNAFFLLPPARPQDGRQRRAEAGDGARRTFLDMRGAGQ